MLARIPAPGKAHEPSQRPGPGWHDVQYLDDAESPKGRNSIWRPGQGPPGSLPGTGRVRRQTRLRSPGSVRPWTSELKLTGGRARRREEALHQIQFLLSLTVAMANRSANISTTWPLLHQYLQDSAPSLRWLGGGRFCSVLRLQCTADTQTQLLGRRRRLKGRNVMSASQAAEPASCMYVAQNVVLARFVATPQQPGGDANHAP